MSYACEDIRRQLPELAAVDYTQCRHERWKRSGIARNGHRGQMWQCVMCGRVRRDERIRDSRQERIMLLAGYYRNGWSARQAALKAGYSERSADRFFRLFREYGEQGKCGCGRDGSHRGTCRYRLEALKPRARR